MASASSSGSLLLRTFSAPAPHFGHFLCLIFWFSPATNLFCFCLSLPPVPLPHLLVLFYEPFLLLSLTSASSSASSSGSLLLRTFSAPGACKFCLCLCLLLLVTIETPRGRGAVQIVFLHRDSPLGGRAGRTRTKLPTALCTSIVHANSLGKPLPCPVSGSNLTIRLSRSS